MKSKGQRVVKTKLKAKDGSGDGGSEARKGFNATQFLKVSLAISVSFNFVWVSQQLASLDTHDRAADAAFVAPVRAANGRAAADDRALPRPLDRRRPVSPFDPRTGSAALATSPLRSRLSPNAELSDLVASRVRHGCPAGLVFVADHVLPDEVTHPSGRRIPRLLHVTTKSRCMTPMFANNLNRWKDVLGSTYSIYVHDDAAVNRFLYQKRWTEFPELKEVLSCVTAGVRPDVFLLRPIPSTLTPTRPLALLITLPRQPRRTSGDTSCSGSTVACTATSTAARGDSMLTASAPKMTPFSSWRYWESRHSTGSRLARATP